MNDTPTTPKAPEPVDHLAAARATRANLEMLTRDAYMQNAPTLIAEAQLDATMALAEATRAMALVHIGELRCAAKVIATWSEGMR